MTGAGIRPDPIASGLPQTVFGMTQAGSAGTLLFFPDFGGNTLYARPLVRLLGEQVSCYGLRFAPDMIAAFADLTIEEIGRRFAADIAAIPFKRPVHLLGFSFAAALAFETAGAMTVKGAPPENLWVLDLPAPVPRRLREILRHPLLHLRLIYRQLRKTWRGVVLRRADTMILQIYGLIGFDLRDHPEAYRFIIRHLYAAYGKYKAKAATSQITVLCAQGNRLGRAVADDLGWQPFSAGKIVSHLVPGDHLGMLRVPENAAVIAKLISADFSRQAVKASDPSTERVDR
jgi:thioesterase domain-containing protein